MNLQKENGFVLLLVFILVVLMGIFAVVATNMTKTTMSFFSNIIDKESSLYYAEAGFNRYLFFLNEDPEFYNTAKSQNLEDADKIPFENGYYKLEITPPPSGSSVVTVQSTGWVEGEAKRTIETEIARQTFSNWVYGTNKEEMTDETKIWWTDDDVVDGPFRTNGDLHIDGDPVFNGPVTYSGDKYVESGSDPEYNGGFPKYAVDPVEFPQNNENLKNEAQANGYYYEGRTCIMVDGDQLHIRNQNGLVVTKSLPENGVIYVDSLGGSSKFGYNSGNVFISGELNGRLTVASENNIYITGYDPTNGEDPYNLDSDDYTGGITYLDSPVDGESDDMLGLVANNNIEILHKGWLYFNSPYTHWSESYADDVAPENINIQAAMFTLDGSFAFEYYNDGVPKGTINFLGSMFQNNRGPVGTFDSWSGNKATGYDKNYSYDLRMKRYTPPHYVEPENAGWEILNWKIIE